MPRYKVIDCEKIHDGKHYGIGDEMEVSEEVAAMLRLEPAPNAKDMLKLVGACETMEDLEKLIEGETRQTILEAAAKKRERLEAKTRDGK